MERSIIHYNHGTLFQRRQKLVRKPKFKKAAVHRPTILKWCKDLVRHLSGNNAAAFILSTADPPEHPLPPWRISIFPVQICIYATFIHIGNLFWRYILDFLLICGYFFRILLLIAGRIFFVLSSSAEVHHVCRFHCTQMLRPFLTGMRPDVPSHKPSVFLDQSFGNSGVTPFSLNPQFPSAASPIRVSSILIL